MEIIEKIYVTITRKKTLSNDIEATKLQRCLGTFQITLLGCGHMIGAGVYILTGSVVRDIAGPATMVSFLIAGLAAFLSALCLAEFGANIPKAGCSYTYVYIVLGEIWGFLVGWNLILENILTCASTARAFSANLDALFNNQIQNFTLSQIGGLGSYLSWLSNGPDFVALVYTITIYIVIVIGVKLTVQFNTFFTLTNMLIILFTTACGIYYADVDNWLNSDRGGFFPFGANGTIAGAATCFFAYTGFDAMAIASEEAREPAKSIPRAIIMAMAIVTTMYILGTAGLTLMMPYQDVDLGAPFPSALLMHGLQWAKYLVAAGTLVGLTSTILASAYSLPRLAYAMADDGLLFSPFAFVYSRTQTPVWSILTFGIIAALLALLVELKVLAEIISIGTLFAFTLNSMAIIIYRYSLSNLSQRPDSLDNKNASKKAETTSETKSILRYDEEHEAEEKISNSCWLNSVSHGTFVRIIVFVLVLSLICLASSILYGWSHLERDFIWPYLLMGIFLAMAFSCVVILLRQREIPLRIPFKVPLVPWIPLLSIFLNLSLMLSLNGATWLRLVIWIVIGLVVYVCYGVWRSKERNPGEYINLDDMSSASQTSTTSPHPSIPLPPPLPPPPPLKTATQ